MADYIFLLESRLSADQMNVLVRMQELAQKNQVNLYLVGGAVRDLICGYPIRDLDFVVEGSALRVARGLSDEEAEKVEFNEKFRAAEITFRSGVRASVSMARLETYAKPATPPDIRQGTIIEDLRRRDFAASSIAISLNPASRGLLLDPTNGLADLEKRELRVLHNYTFVHDPVRLLRIVRYAVRLGFRIEAKSADLLRTAIERRFYEMIEPTALGNEARQVAYEENPVAVLRGYDHHGLLRAFHPRLEKRLPDYTSLAKFWKIRQTAEEAGFRVDGFPGLMFYVLRRLKPRERANVLRRLALGRAEFRRLMGWESEARRVAKMLQSRRTAKPLQVYHYLVSVPLDVLVFIQSYYPQKKVQQKVRNFFAKYVPLRRALPVRDLESLGVPRGPKFDQILEQFFELQLAGKAKTHPEQLRLLRKLAGLPKPKPPAKAKPARAEKRPKAVTTKKAGSKPKPKTRSRARRAVRPRGKRRRK